MDSPSSDSDSPTPTAPLPSSEGYWRLAARRFGGRWTSRLSLGLLGALVAMALAAPLIVGTRPIICRYKGSVYFPFVAYYWKAAEPSFFHEDGFRGTYPRNLLEKDPESWAVWPLVYQDPYRRVYRGEWPDDPGNATRQAPSTRHLFGTDDRGRDVFARVVFGTQIALVVGMVSMAIAGLIGVLLGGMAGYLGGVVDHAVSRAIEVLMSIPTLVLVLALVAVVPRPTMWHLMVLIGVTRWEATARYTRGEFLRLRGSDFVLASRGLGASWPRIAFVHLLPNALAPVIVTLSFGVANAILIESALSFLGFGVAPPSPSWGSILASWMEQPSCWWLAVFPSLGLFLSVLTYNLLGDGLQEALDPRRAAS